MPPPRPMRILSSSLLVASALAALPVVACSSTAEVSGPQGDAGAQGTDPVDAGAPPVDAAPDATTVHVTPPPLPVIPNQGGPILANPELVTVMRYADFTERDIPQSWFQRDFLPRFNPE